MEPQKNLKTLPDTYSPDRINFQIENLKMTTLDKEHPHFVKFIEHLRETRLQVYRDLVEICLEARKRGHDCWSMEAAYQIVRWTKRGYALRKDSEGFKLNDHHRSLYARLIMENNPELAGFFELRY